MANELDPEFKREGALIRRFLIKIVVKVIAIAVILFLSYLITETPIFTNQIAMHQLENSNDWFVAMHMYQKFANVFGRVSGIVIAFIIGFMGYDGYSLAKSLNT